MLALNVGGTVFYTSRETLRAHESFFRGLADADPCDPATPPFVDRDPTHFRFVLNYLRGSRVLPDDPLALRELEVEADFYALHDLRDAARVQLARPPTSVHAGLRAIAERL